eukprot:scaffold20057_cov61-Phaeocystis_antarctica.AAC.1
MCSSSASVYASLRCLPLLVALGAGTSDTDSVLGPCSTEEFTPGAAADAAAGGAVAAAWAARLRCQSSAMAAE